MNSGAATALIALLTLIFMVISAILTIVVRGERRQTRTEDKVSQMVDKVEEIVRDKDRIHKEMLEQMRYDRDATNKRLRFVEEWFMRKGPT